MHEPFETLKQILRHVRDPEVLNDHPWTRSLFVQEAVLESPHLQEVAPGQQLIGAIARLFPGIQPSAPPRHGKRLDPRWGEFGLLAALYFTPFNHGTPYPTSLMDGWGRIDPAILYFVYGRPADALCEQEIKRYELVGADLEYGAASTLSDWHKKGLQRFSELILNRERFLARNRARPSILLEPARANGAARTGSRARSRRVTRWLWLVVAFTLVLALGLGASTTWRMYEGARLVYQDVIELQVHLQVHVMAALDVDAVEAAAPLLTNLQRDLAAFKAEARPLLGLGPNLAWIPVYGGDLASAPVLIELAEHLLSASLLSVQASGPLLSEFDSQSSTLDPGSLTALLVQAQPQLADARRELDAALAARARIDVQHLSPSVQSLVIEDLDPVLELADEGLSLALALPGILGAGNDGPKTYLLLAQNEDELRPTGGFITSVGNLVLHKGEVISLEFEAVDDNAQEDWSKPYPSAPWQLQEYMNSRVLILRDANWFTDFPTTAMWVEYLYAYTHSHSVDGIMAFDQRFLVMLLGEVGPLEVQNAPYPLTAENVVEYMRQAKVPPEDATVGWYRKEFIGDISAALLAELTAGKSHDLRGLLQVLFQALAERHLLLQFDDPAFAGLMAERGWDGAVRHGAAGDFLMVADTNIGFNKTSAVVDVSLAYDVDLTDIAAPQSNLTVTHTNNAPRDVRCIHWNTEQIAKDRDYPINRCYWTYLRAYKQAGTELVDATPHAVPGGWILVGEPVPARVDILEEGLQGAQGFGTLLVVPGGKSLSTGFQFGLPAAVLSTSDRPGELTYRLHVQKQPGTLAVPLTIRIHLPDLAALQTVSANALVQDHNLLIETDLRTDLELEVTFTLPYPLSD